MNECVGSDEIVEINCEKCSFTSENAEYFCVDCVSLMCSSCKASHDLFLTGHTFEEGSNIPYDLYRMKCSKHVSKVTKFYCLKCSNFICATCKHCDHSSCTNMIKSVPSLSKGFIDSREFKDFYKRIIDADVKIQEVGTTNTTNLSEIEYNKDKTINDIEEIRDEIIVKVKSLSDELCKSLQLEASSYLANALTTETEQTLLKENVKGIKHDLEHKRMSRSNCLLFKTTREEDIDKIESSLLTLEKTCAAFHCRFQPSEDIEKIRSILNCTTSFGRLKQAGNQDTVRDKLREKLRLFRR